MEDRRVSIFLLQAKAESLALSHCSTWNFPTRIFCNNETSLYLQFILLVPVYLSTITIRLQPGASIRNLLPILLSKRPIRLIPWRNPQEIITLTISHLCPDKRGIYSLLTQRHLVLLVVMDMGGFIDYPEEDWHCVAWQLGAGIACESGIVKGLPCVWADLECCAAGTAFVVG